MHNSLTENSTLVENTGANTGVSLERLRKLNEFAGYFNLTIWVDRDDTFPEIPVAEEYADTNKTITTNNSYLYPMGGNQGLAANGGGATLSKATSSDGGETTNPQTKQEKESDGDPADTNKNTASTEKTQDKNMRTDSSTKATSLRPSLRIGALLYGNILVLYSLRNKVGMLQDERELLTKMLEKCGVNMAEYRFNKENILVYPPLIKNLEEVLSQDKNALQNTIKGFIKALSDKSRHSTGQDLYILILGEDVVQDLPEYKQFTSNAPIVLDSLRVMLDEPQRRKVAWDLLKPLRDVLATDSTKSSD